MWITKDHKNKITWVDILKPTKADIDFLKKHHRFHPIILDELLHLSSRSRVEFYNDYLFLTYHLPHYDAELKASRRAEIDFLVTKKSVITVHYEELEPITSFMRAISNNIHLKQRAFENTSRLVYYLIQEIIHFSMRQLRHIEERMNYISQEIFKGREVELLQTISHTKRDALNYTVISAPQEILLNSLLEIGTRFWGLEAKIYLADLVGDHLKVTQHIENYRDVIESLEETNGQLLSAKTNSVMQRFTILAFLTFPVFLLFSLLSVSWIGGFILATPLRFWIVFLGVIALVVSLVMVFKKKKWL